MKKILMFISVLVLSLMLISCKDKVEYSFEAEAEAETVEVGEIVHVYAETNKPNANFVFTSSDENIATVNSVGAVTGKNVGEVTITVSLENVGEKKVTITVIPKNMTSTELKVSLNQILNEYISSKHGYIKVTANDGVTQMTSETIFNYKEDGSLDSLMYKVVTGSEIHVYVKEGFSYMFANNRKTKKVLTAQEETTIKTIYGHSKFLEPVTKFYNEDEFYSALVFSKTTAEEIEFDLDLSKYTGKSLNTAGVDEFKIVVSFSNNKVVKVEIKTKEASLNKSVVVEYKGTDVQIIAYPADLDLYTE